jgi:hypothetical protein
MRPSQLHQNIELHPTCNILSLVVLNLTGQCIARFHSTAMLTSEYTTPAPGTYV